MEWNPVSWRSDEMEVWPSSVLGKRKGGDSAQLAWGGCVCDSSAGTSWPLGEMEVAALKRPPLAFSIHVLSAPYLSVAVHRCLFAPVGAGSYLSIAAGASSVPSSSFDNGCVRAEAPDSTQRENDYLAHDELHRLRREGGVANAFVDHGCDGSQAGSCGGRRYGSVGRLA